MAFSCLSKTLPRCYFDWPVETFACVRVLVETCHCANMYEHMYTLATSIFSSSAATCCCFFCVSSASTSCISLCLGRRLAISTAFADLFRLFDCATLHTFCISVPQNSYALFSKCGSKRVRERGRAIKRRDISSLNLSFQVPVRIA